MPCQTASVAHFNWLLTAQNLSQTRWQEFLVHLGSRMAQCYNMCVVSIYHQAGWKLPSFARDRWMFPREIWELQLRTPEIPEFTSSLTFSVPIIKHHTLISQFNLYLLFIQILYRGNTLLEEFSTSVRHVSSREIYTISLWIGTIHSQHTICPLAHINTHSLHTHTHHGSSIKQATTLPFTCNLLHTQVSLKDMDLHLMINTAGQF